MEPMSQSYLDIEGWFGFEGFYDSIVRDAKAGAVFVEVGCWKGLSTVYLGMAIEASGKPIILHCVDTFTGSPGEQFHQDRVRESGGSVFPIFRENLKRFAVKADVHITDSLSASNLFGDGKVDFVFIDADHEEASVAADIIAWLPKIKPGGILAGHDYHGDWPGVPAAVDKLLPGRFLMEGNVWAHFL